MLGAAAFYDLVAEEYDRRWAYPPYATARQTAWLARVCPIGPLLDLGCGTGRMLRPLTTAGFDPIGLDLSAGMLAQARRSHPTARLVRADAAQGLPLADRSLTTIISLHATISHVVEGAARRRIAEEALRVLKPGGVMVLELPHPGSFPRVEAPGRWRTFRPGISCLRRDGKTEELRLDHRPETSTLVCLLGLEDIKEWLGGFDTLHVHPGFSGGRFKADHGDAMVICAWK